MSVGQGEADMLLQLVVLVLGAGAVYGGIRSDLKATRERADEAKRSADRAHDRINEHIERRHGERVREAARG